MPRWFRALCLSLLPMLAGWHTATAAQPVATELTEARRVVSRGGAVISDQIVRLPDTLEAAWRSEQVHIAYTFGIDAAQPGDTPQALWLFRVGAPFRLTINGQQVSERLPVPTAWSRLWSPAKGEFNGRVPILVGLPEARSHVRIAFLTLPYMPAGLIEIQHGPVDRLTLLHLERIEAAGLSIDVSKTIASTLGLIALLLWLVRPGNRVLLFFASMCICIATRDWLYSSARLPLPPMVFEQSNPFLILCFAISAQAATLLLFDQFTRSRKRWLIAIWVVFATLFVLAELMGSGALVLRGSVVLLGNFTLLFIVGQIWRWRARLPPGRAWVLVAGYTMLLLGSLHDLGMATGQVSAQHGTQIPWGFTALVLCYAVITADHVLRQLALAENAQKVLQQRVSETRLELETSYRRIAQHEQQAAVRQERTYIMRELHDSLGSQLITALRGVERDALSKENLVQALQDSLSDLRQLLSTDRADGRLVAALANWRQHWEDRLNSAGVRTGWAIDDSVDTVVLKPDHLHHLMRILQEVTTNTLKHAQASTLLVQAERHEGQLVLTFSDNGSGFKPPNESLRAVPSGQGLAGMHSRAAQMGGTLSMAAGTGGMGTCVRLVLPLPESGPNHPAGQIAQSGNS